MQIPEGQGTCPQEGDQDPHTIQLPNVSRRHPVAGTYRCVVTLTGATVQQESHSSQSAANITSTGELAIAQAFQGDAQLQRALLRGEQELAALERDINVAQSHKSNSSRRSSRPAPAPKPPVAGKASRRSTMSSHNLPPVGPAPPHQLAGSNAPAADGALKWDSIQRWARGDSVDAAASAEVEPTLAALGTYAGSSGGQAAAGRLSGVSSTSTSSRNNATQQQVAELQQMEAEILRQRMQAAATEPNPTTGDTNLMKQRMLEAQMAADASVAHQASQLAELKSQVVGLRGGVTHQDLVAMQNSGHNSTQAVARAEIQLQEERTRHAAEMHVQQKEVEMLRSQLAAAQKSAASARVGGVTDRAAVQELEVAKTAAEQYASEQAAEARAANKAKKAALQARDAAQEEAARHLAEVNKLKRRVSAAEEVSQVAQNEAKQLRMARSDCDSKLDEASEEVYNLQNELQVIKARLNVRESHERELMEDRTALAALRREHQQLLQERDQLLEELDAVMVALRGMAEALPAQARHNIANNGTPQSAVVRSLVRVDLDSTLHSQASTMESKPASVGDLQASRLANRISHEVRKLAVDAENVRSQLVAMQERMMRLESEALSCKQGSATAETMLQSEQQARQQASKQLQERADALAHAESELRRVTEARNVLERELEKRVREAQATEAEMQKLRKDLDRLTMEESATSTRAKEAEGSLQRDRQELTDLQVRMQSMTSQLKASDEDASRWMLRAREAESRMLAMERESESALQAERAAVTQTQAKSDRLQELRTALTAAMHERQAAKAALADQERATEEAQRLAERETGRADELQQELQELQRLSEQQVQVANQAYNNLCEVTRQKMESMEEEVTRARFDAERSAQEKESLVESTRVTAERSAGLMISALESEVESLRHAIKLKETESQRALEQIEMRAKHIDQIQHGLQMERVNSGTLKGEVEKERQRVRERGNALVQTLSEAIRSAASDAPELVQILGQNKAAWEDVGIQSQELANVLLSRVRQLVWERQCCEEELVASKEAALRAAASMDEHSKSTRQLAATLADEIAAAKQGEMRSLESANQLKARIESEQQMMEQEKHAVRQQVSQLMSGALKAREAAAAGIREANRAREAAEKRATAALEEAGTLHNKLAEYHHHCKEVEEAMQTQVARVELSERNLKQVQETLGKRLADAEEHLASSKAECEKLFGEVARFRSLEAEYQESLKTTATDHQTLAKEHAVLRKKFTKNSSQLSDLRSVKNKLTKELAEVQKQIPPLQNNLAMVEKDRESIRSEKDKQTSLAAKYKKELEESRHGHTLMEQEMTNAIDQLQEVVMIRGSLEAKLTQADKSLAAHQKEQKQYMEQLQSAEQALAAARTEIQVLIERTTQREDKIEHLQQTLEKLDQERLTIGEQRDQAHKEAEEAVIRMTQAESKADALQAQMERTLKEWEEAKVQWDDEKCYLLKAQNAALEVADTNANAKVDRMQELRNSVLELQSAKDQMELLIKNEQAVAKDCSSQLKMQVAVRQALETEVETLNLSLLELQSRCAQQKQQLDQQASAMHLMSDDLRHKCAEADETRAIVHSTAEDIVEVQGELAFTAEEHRATKLRVRELEGLLQRCREKEGDMLEEMRKCRTKMERQEQMLMDVQDAADQERTLLQQRSKLEEERLATVRMEVERSVQKANHAQESLVQCRTRVEVLERELHEMHAAEKAAEHHVSMLKDETNAMRMEMANLQRSLADKEEFVAKLRHEKDHLTYEHERTLQERLENKENHLFEIINAKEKSLYNMIEEKERNTHQLLAQKDAALAEREAELLAERAQSMQRAADLEAQLEEHAHAMRELENLQESLAELQAKHAQSLDNLTALQKEKHSNLQEVQELRAALARMQDENMVTAEKTGAAELHAAKTLEEKQTSLIRAAVAALEVATAAREEAVTRRRAAMGAGVSITPEQLEAFELDVQRCQAAVLEAHSTLERLQRQASSNEQAMAVDALSAELAFTAKQKAELASELARLNAALGVAAQALASQGTPLPPSLQPTPCSRLTSMGTTLSVGSTPVDSPTPAASVAHDASVATGMDGDESFLSDAPGQSFITGTMRREAEELRQRVAAKRISASAIETDLHRSHQTLQAVASQDQDTLQQLQESEQERVLLRRQLDAAENTVASMRTQIDQQRSVFQSQQAAISASEHEEQAAALSKALTDTQRAVRRAEHAEDSLSRYQASMASKDAAVEEMRAQLAAVSIDAVSAVRKQLAKGGADAREVLAAVGAADEGVSGEAAARLALERLGDVDNVIATWRDACADKDRTLQQLQEELVAKSEHLARREAMHDEESARAQSLALELRQVKEAALDVAEQAKRDTAAEMRHKDLQLEVAVRERDEALERVANLEHELRARSPRGLSPRAPVQQASPSAAVSREETTARSSAEAEGLLEAARRRLDVLAGELAVSQRAADDAASELAEHQRSALEATARAEMAEGTMLQLQEDLVRERSALSQMESAAEASAAQLAETRLELAKLKRAGESMAEHTAQWREKAEQQTARVEELQEHLRRLKEESEHKVVQRVERMQEALLDAKHVQSQSDAMIAELRQQVQAQTDAARAASDHAADLEVELDQMQHQLEIASERVAALSTQAPGQQEALASARAELVELQESNEQMRRDMETARALQENMRELQERMTRAEAERDEMYARMGEVQQASVDTTRLQERVRAQEVELAAMQSTLVATEEALALAKSTTQGLKQLTLQNAQLDPEDARVRLTASEQRVAEARAEASKMQRQVAAHEGALAELRAQLAEREGATANASRHLERQLAEATHAASAAARRAAVSEAQCQELEGAVRSKNALVLELRDRLDQAAANAQAAAEAAARAQVGATPGLEATPGGLLPMLRASYEGSPLSAASIIGGEDSDDARVRAVERVIDMWRGTVEARELEIGELTAQLEVQSERAAAAERKIEALRTKLSVAEATANATTSTASEREQHTFQWLDQTANALSESREAHVVAVAETKKVTQQLHQAEAKIGRAAAVLQKLLPVSEHTSGSGLSEMPIVEMSMQVVSAVEDAQKHAQVLLAQSSSLQVQMQSKTEEVCSLRLEMKAVQEELAAKKQELWHTTQKLNIAEKTKGEENNSHSLKMDAAVQEYRAEVQTLKEQLQTKTQEARELSHMLRAWEAMRAGKDQQIAQLVELSKRFEDESHQKTRTMEALRNRAGGSPLDPSPEGVPAGGSRSFPTVRPSSGEGGASSSAGTTTLAQRLFGGGDSATKVSASSAPAFTSHLRKGPSMPRVLQAKPAAVYSLKGSKR